MSFYEFMIFSICSLKIEYCSFRLSSTSKTVLPKVFGMVSYHLFIIIIWAAFPDILKLPAAGMRCAPAAGMLPLWSCPGFPF